jgi:hypothetical protein
MPFALAKPLPPPDGAPYSAVERWVDEYRVWAERERALQRRAREDLSTIAWIVRHERNLLPTDPRWLAMTDLDIRLEYFRIQKWKHFQVKKVMPEDDDGIALDEGFGVTEWLAEHGYLDDDWEPVDLDQL